MAAKTAGRQNGTAGRRQKPSDGVQDCRMGFQNPAILQFCHPAI
jgi:hypothetical protein